MMQNKTTAIIVIISAAVLVCLAGWWVFEGSAATNEASISVTATIPNTASAFPKRRATDEAQDITFRVPKLDAEKLESLRAPEKRNVPFQLVIR